MGKLRYLIQRALRMDYKAMLDKIGSIHRKTGRSRLAIFRDMKDCAVAYGAGYMDYDLFEMYDLTPEQRDTYLTRPIWTSWATRSVSMPVSPLSSTGSGSR